MRFSPRLRAILACVKGSRCLADIGTDHGYLPIAACSEGMAERAVACDVAAGPLEIARANVRRYGLEARIECRLGYGLRPLGVGEADCVVIAGMGGANMVEILNEAELSGVRRLIVQPQRDIDAVRGALGVLGFEVVEEVTALDRGRTYTVIVAEGG